MFTAQAPSNIALIKYMGKESTPRQVVAEASPLGRAVNSTSAQLLESAASMNRPTNASLSYTLNHLLSTVELHPLLQNKTSLQENLDQWQSLDGHVQLSLKGQEKFLKHFSFLKRNWNLTDSFLIKSTNNFPSDCGLASSASSFAALTLATARVLESKNKVLPTLSELSALSRIGSGSSCRSFYSPWALWRREFAEPVEGLPKELLHFVVVMNDQVKSVSSSAAHQLVLKSPYFEGRVARAEERLLRLLQCLQKVAPKQENLLQNTAYPAAEPEWLEAYQICWDEFEDMHQLFETVPDQPFSYRNAAVYAELELMQQLWKKNKNGPLVTMDAGPNIHCLFLPQNKDLYFAWKHEFSSRYPVLGVV